MKVGSKSQLRRIHAGVAISLARGMTEELRNKIDTLYALGRLTEEQYREPVSTDDDYIAMTKSF